MLRLTEEQLQAITNRSGARTVHLEDKAPSREREAPVARLGKPEKTSLALFFPDWPEAVTEYRFHPTRKWRFDWAIVQCKIAIEQQGGLFVQGRHSRGAGVMRDMEKLNHAVLDGWRVLLFTPQQVKSGEAAEWVRKLLA